MKKIIALSLVLIMSLSCFSHLSFAVDSDVTEHLTKVPSGYTGIYTIEDLYCVRNNLAGNYILMNNIDLSSATATNGDWNYNNSGWNPIGSDDSYSNLAFSGVFNGNNYCIKGINIKAAISSSNKYSLTSIGLFSNVSGTVCDLRVTGDYNITFRGVAGAGLAVGGITANCTAGTLKNCISDVDITVDVSWSGTNSNVTYGCYVGGVSGYCTNKSSTTATVTSCINIGKINCNVVGQDPSLTMVSGVVGSAYKGITDDDIRKTTYLSQCVNTGDVTVGLKYSYSSNTYDYEYSAYSCGIMFGGDIRSCYNTGKITANLLYDSSKPSRKNSYASGITSRAKYISDCYNVGEIVGDAGSFAISKIFSSDVTTSFGKKSYYLNDRGSNSQSKFTSLTNAQMKLSSMYSDWDFDTVWTMSGRSDYNYPELQSVKHIFSGENISHEHSYIASITRPATHTTTGLKTFTCSCGKSYTQTIPKLAEHTYEKNVTLPTCISQGYTTYTCECGDIYVDDYVEATSHEYTSKITIPATHAEAGIMTYTCDCGVTYTETIEKIADHSYNVVITEPTCIAKGYTTYICECNDSYIADYVDAKGHDFKATVTEPDCTEFGYTTFVCECGESYISDYVNANGHIYTSEITTPATHLTDGVETFVCECGDTYTKPIAKTATHTYDAVITAPTCTEKGYTTYTCECGDSQVSDYTNMINHEYAEEVTIQPSHNEEGLKTYTCECGYIYTETIGKTTEHTYTSEVTTQPTHLSNGVKTFTCECGDTYTEVIEKIAEHTYNGVVTAPTCTSKGYTTYTCECNDSYVADEVEVLKHKDENSDYKCDYDCGYEFEKPADPTPDEPTVEPEDPTKNCSCNCHKGGLAGFFFKIINFFQKLFGMNKVCTCGVKH